METKRSLVVVAIAAAALAGACSEESRDALEDDVRSAVSDAVDVASEAGRDAIEAAARNFAAVQGRQAFERAGYELDGELDCTADVTDGFDQVDVSCTGTTTDGTAVEVQGTTNEIPGLSINELDGEFVGTVDGEEVFSTGRLGN